MNTFLRDRKLSPEAKLVGAVFASYADAHGVAWPGTQRLMRETGFGRHVVERARSELVKGHYLSKFYPRYPNGELLGVRFRVTESLLRPALARTNEPLSKDGGAVYRFPGIRGHRRTGTP